VSKFAKKHTRKEAISIAAQSAKSRLDVALSAHIMENMFFVNARLKLCVERKLLLARNMLSNVSDVSTNAHGFVKRNVFKIVFQENGFQDVNSLHVPNHSKLALPDVLVTSRFILVPKDVPL